MSIVIPNPTLLSPENIVEVSNIDSVAYGDSSNIDAFGRLRMSSPQYVFDAQLTYDLQPLLFEPLTTGAGATIAHSSTNRMAVLTFAATPTGGKAFMQQFECNRYQPGRSQMAFVTFNFIEHTANVVKFAGYSDGVNGVEFQSTGTDFQVVIYSATTNGTETIARASWVDPLDGTGPSGITLDVSKVQIFVVDMQALYTGRVRVYLDLDGVLTKIVDKRHANVIATPYIQSANLPVRCGMTCTGTVSTTMNFICCSVLSEGGQGDEGGFHFSANVAMTAASGARTHAMSLQPRLTFNGITNRARFVPESVEILAGTNPVMYEICYGQALTAAAFADVNSTYSTMQVDTAGTLSGSPAIVDDTGFVASSASARGSNSFTLPVKFPVTLDAAGAVRVLGRLTLLLTGFTGSSNCHVALCWKEIR